MIQRWSLAALAACSVAFSLDAATLVVDASGGGDFATIQAAVKASVNGDVVLIRAGTYAEHLTLGGKLITLRGEGRASEVVLRSPDGGTMMRLENGETSSLRFEDLTFTGGLAASLIEVSGASPVFERCIFRENLGRCVLETRACGDTGGGTYRSCLFLANSEPNGGAMYLSNSNATVEDCAFVDNTAVGPTSGVNAGGAIYVNDWNCGIHTFRFTRCQFANNAAYWGGAIYSQGTFPNSPTQMLVTDCVFAGNAAVEGRSMWNWYITAPISGSWFCGGSDQIRNWWSDAGGNNFGGDCSSLPYADCDGDRVSDLLEIQLGLSADCDSDGLPDACAIATGAASDTNANGIPDACETFHVPSEYTTIQDAVDAAPSGAIVLVAPGTYAPFDFRSKQIVVRSAAGAATTIIDAAGLPMSAVVFGAGSPMQATLRGFTIRPGAGSFINPASPSYRGGGGCFLLDGSGQIEDCVFVGGASGCGYGGGVWSTNGSIAVRRCSFESIGVEHYGGAIAVHPRFSSVTVSGEPEGTRVLIEDCTIRNCSSFNVGGIDIRLFTDWTVGNMSGRVVVRRCEFFGNSSSVHGRDILAAGFGGADPAALARLEDCVFGSSGTVVQMGYYDAAGGGTMEVDGCVIGSQNAQISQTAGALSVANSWFCDGSVSVNGAWTDLGGNSATCPPAYDCDGNGIDDFYDIILGRLPDTDGDFITDGCEPISVPGDFPTIQAAIDSVAVGVREVIEVAAGTYNGSFALNGKDIVVRGAPNNATILDGAGLSSSIARFTGNEPATAGVENLVFRNGTAGSLLYQGAAFDVGGAIYGLNSAAFIRNCRFEHCASDYGGAVYLLYCRMNVSGCTFDSNTAFDEGGGLFVYETTGPVLNCVFTSNDTSVNGPGAGSAFKAVGVRSTGEAVELTGCTFAGNRGLLTASAIEYYENVQSNPGVLRISGCSVTGNQSGTTIPSGAAGLRVLGRNTSCIITGGTTICSNSPKNIEGPFLIEGAATLCECFADVTGDGLVNGGDLGVLLSAWGIALPSGDGDVNHDGLVNGSDLSIVLSSWGACH